MSGPTSEERHDAEHGQDRALRRARRVRLRSDPGRVAAGLGRDRAVPVRPARRPAPEEVRPRHVPVPLRRPAHGSRRGVRPGRRRSRGTGCSGATTCCTRSGGTRSACPPRTPRSSAASTRPRGRTRTSRRRRRPCGGTRALRLGPGAEHLRPGVLPVEPVAVPADVRARAGLPQALAGQLVPQRPDRAGQRAGRRRPVRAVRHPGHQEEADPVVLPDHRLRRPAAGRHGRSWRARGRTRS